MEVYAKSPDFTQPYIVAIHYIQSRGYSIYPLAWLAHAHAKVHRMQTVYSMPHNHNGRQLHASQKVEGCAHVQKNVNNFCSCAFLLKPSHPHSRPQKQFNKKLKRKHKWQSLDSNPQQETGLNI